MSTNTKTMMTHKYIPRIQQREDNLFIEEYYSGTDTKVYLNGSNEPAEISYINFSVNEQLKPIYGYASRTFDDMAVGSRIVTGVFKMPIKNPNLQDTYETVVEGKEPQKTTLEEIEDNNKKEEEIKNNTEWVGNNDSSTNIQEEYKEETATKTLNIVGAPGGDYVLFTLNSGDKYYIEEEIGNNYRIFIINSVTGKKEYGWLNKNLLKEFSGQKTVTEKVGVVGSPTNPVAVLFTLEPGEIITIEDKNPLNNYYHISITSSTGIPMHGWLEASKITEVE